MDVFTGARVERLEADDGGVRVVFRVGEQTRSVQVAAAFFAVGWPGNADLIGAEAAGIAVPERGYVVTDDISLRTSVAHIFAAGDVNGKSKPSPV